MGREKFIKDPQILWELFADYKKHTKENPIRQHDFIGGRELNEVHREKERPLTLVGFYNYCYENASDVHNYFENTEGRYEAFEGICTRIKEAIRQDQIEGGMAGIYNPSITQRLNGLVERQQREVTKKKLPDWMEDDESKS